MAVLWPDLDVVVTPANIQRGEECLALELFENVGDLWYGIVSRFDRTLCST
jgi:hypothetical protein